MNNRKQILGKSGENKAVEYIKTKNYKIIQTNYRTMLGEIDIIAEHENFLVFIEVKNRTNSNFKAIDSIPKSKQTKIAKTAEIFLSENLYYDKQIRFDVILIDSGKINLIQNAFIIL